MKLKLGREKSRLSLLFFYFLIDENEFLQNKGGNINGSYPKKNW